MSEAKHVYQAVTAVTAAMAREGIGKTRDNLHQNYKFRGIDEVYNALSSHLAEQHLCILPRVIDRSMTERATNKGGVSTYTVLTVEFDFVSSVDGSMHTIRTMGEAMDSADKSTNKAMSAAMKYACLIAFQIPTEGDNDADAHHPQKASPRNGSSGGQQSSPARGTQPEPSSPRAGAAPSSDDWLEWEMRHSASMLDAKTPGELKAAFSTAWREAEYRHAPQHIMQKLEKCKNEIKVRFSGAA